MLTLKRTVLIDEHKALNARLVDFAGFEMPIQYESIIKEHNAVRANLGVFDVSHMGEFLVSGEDSLKFLNYLIPNDIKKIEQPGKGLYTQLCNESGGTVDDLIIYNLDNCFLVVVNASNIDKDWKWFNSYTNGFNVQLKNTSNNMSLLAVQGPSAVNVLSSILGVNLQDQKYFDIKKYDSYIVARTGYTGEDGFEIFIDDENKAVSLWQQLIKLGAVPCGLGARDTLRLEAAYPLYGHELDDVISPLEAGLGWSVKLDKSIDFIGKQILLKQKQEGLQKKLICLKINDKLIARQGHKVYNQNKEEIGIVCSGSQGISVGYPIATAFVSSQYAEVNKELLVGIRDRLIAATIVQRPFYRRK